MNKMQILEKIKQNPKGAVFVAVLIILFLYNISSRDRAYDSHANKNAPYGSVTMNALDAYDSQAGTTEPTDEPPAIQSPANMALMVQMKAFFGFDPQKPTGVLYATTTMPSSLSYEVRKPADYASKIIFKNISPNKAVLGEAVGDMSIDVLQPMHETEKGGVFIGAYSKSDVKDFWSAVFYDKMKVGYTKKEEMHLDMMERHQWASIPYKGQVVAEIVPEGFVKLTYIDETGKVVKTVTTQKKAVAFRIAGGDVMMSADVEFYR